MKPIIVLLVMALAGPAAAAAQAPTPAAVDSAAWQTWQELLPGHWSCEGEFANGRKHAADMEFAAVLDGRWISYQHRDRPPGRWHADARWGVQLGAGVLISTMHDNYGGARRFSGTVTPAELVLTLDRRFSESSYDERFVFRRENTGFRMIWETSSNSAGWRMGDYLLCTRL